MSLFVLSSPRASRREGRNHTEMSSFPETKAEKLMLASAETIKTFLWYHSVQISRVYPKAQRVDSSNYLPLSVWNVGCQMAALNFQTGDKPMQLNHAKFLANGNCGYVLRPEYTRAESFNPTDEKAGASKEPINLCVRLLAARHLARKSSRGMVSPFLEVEVRASNRRR